ncbi:MAG: hypothetical protein V3S42_04385 [Candidatus Neomarinimicrobiota bacterium]
MAAPQAIAKGMQNTVNEFMNNPQKVLLKAQRAIGRMAAEYLWVGIVLILLGISWYYRRQLNKKANDNYAMESIYNDKESVIGNINSADANYKLDPLAGTGHLRDYYIASSYNSCCAGDFQDSYVDLVPLKEVIHQGARVLDFALYLVNDDVVVGAGPTDSDNVKGTYNSIPVSGPDGILSTINSYAFQAPTPNPTDPLFIHFRIKSKSKPQLFYKKLTRAVKNAFQSRLLGPEYGHEGRPDAQGNSKNLAREPILNLRGKVIIICDQETNNFRGTPFEELVNMSSGSPFLSEYRNYDVQYTHDPDGLKEYNKKNMTLSMPDLSALNDNVPAQLHFAYGCQMVCMNYANFDSNMQFYRDMFNGARSAFVLKPDNLRYKLVTTTAPVKQNPKVQYAAKQINLPMYQSTI